MLKLIVPVSIALPIGAQTYEADLMKMREEYVKMMSEPSRFEHYFSRMANRVKTVKGVRHVCLLVYATEVWTPASVDYMKQEYGRSWQQKYGYTDVLFMNEGQKEPYAAYIVNSPR